MAIAFSAIRAVRAIAIAVSRPSRRHLSPVDEHVVEQWRHFAVGTAAEPGDRLACRAVRDAVQPLVVVEAHVAVGIGVQVERGHVLLILLKKSLLFLFRNYNLSTSYRLDTYNIDTTYFCLDFCLNWNLVKYLRITHK